MLHCFQPARSRRILRLSFMSVNDAVLVSNSSAASNALHTSDVIGAAGDSDLTTAGSLHNALVRFGADIVQNQLTLSSPPTVNNAV